MKKYFVHSALFFLLNISLTAQTLLRLNIEFQNIKMPLAGGMNCPQFSEIDLNTDGKPDLFVFDRIGNVVTTYLNAGATNQTNFTHAPQYQSAFPALNDWALLRDFDGDGVQDIFTYNDGAVAGIRVFKGQLTQRGWAFTRLNFGTIGNVINYPTPNGSRTNLYVNNVDIPAIDDVDGDGDLDILAFEVGGGHVYFYKNLTLERGFKRDSLIFELADNCWGRFFDNGTTAIVKLGTPTTCASAFKNLNERLHPGASLTTYDRDGDGDKDVVVGSISFPTLTELTNAGTRATAWMNAQDNNFPSSSEKVNIPIFPAAFFVDVNNDGKRDMITAPLSINFIENLNVSWLYRNNGTSTTPLFNITQKNFLVGDMIDLGSGANPAFVDVDADGLMDLVVGNTTFFKTEGRESRLFYFRNTGSATQPRFTLVDNNWLNFRDLSSIDNFNFSPHFADMDGDGDLDLIVGEDSGTLYFVENRAGAGQPLRMAAPVPFWKSLQVGAAAKPHIVDVNRDGLPDLVVGNRSGFLRYYQNIGTRTAPNFSTTPTNNFFGQVDTRGLGSPSGFAAPFFITQNGRWLLLVGNEEGKIQAYDNIENNLNGAFRLLDADYGTIRDGWRSTPALVDLNRDGRLDLMLGNFRGGLTAFQTTYNLTHSRDIFKQKDLMTISPNPISDAVFVKITEGVEEGNLTVYNAVGQAVIHQFSVNTSTILDFKNLQAGVYFIEIKTKNGQRQVLKCAKL